jgi:hypothetical protein
LRLALFAAAAGLFLGGYYWGNQYRRADLHGLESAILLRPVLALPEFRGTDLEGVDFGKERLVGTWSLLALFPPDGASLTGQELGFLIRLSNRLAQFPDLQGQVKILAILPDAAGQDPMRLAQLADPRNPFLALARASRDDLAPLLALLGGNQETPGLFLIDTDARANAVFTPHQDPATIVRDLRVIVQADPR